MEFITNNQIGTNGRLANQLFQYAVLLVFSKIHNVKIKIPIIKTNNKYKRFRLDEIFNLKYEILDDSDKILGTYNEKSENFDENIYKLGFSYKNKGNINLNGWFQSVKYFENFNIHIHKQFQIKNEILLKAKNIYKSYKKNDEIIIALHIRLGDYLSDFNKLIRINVGNNKFIELFKNYFEKKYKNCKFLIISDDIKWCKNNLNTYKNFIYSDNSDIIDFCLLTLSDNLVVSPSTFGWWAFYLNQNAKEVFLPNKWWRPEKTGIVCNFYKKKYTDLKYEFYPKNKTYKLYNPINFTVL